MSVKLKLYYLNLKKTKKQINCDLKLKLNGKRLYRINSVKYLEVNIVENLSSK